MRNLDYLKRYRVPLCGEMGDSTNGAFKMHICGNEYAVIASTGGGWDHVSVSHQSHIPNWKVMQKVKEMFFQDNEVAYQLHPAQKNYINTHPNVLHIWRNQSKDIEMPPLSMV